jgi:alkylhydroperoxidase family enzyme
VPEAKLAAVWEFETSELYDGRERAALRLAAAAAVSPSAVTDQMMEDVHDLFDEQDVVRIVGVIAISGFMNRWNATAATTLEDLPRSAAEQRLASGGWSVGIHDQSAEA